MSPDGVAFIRSGLTVLAILAAWAWWTYYGVPMWRRWGARNVQASGARLGTATLNFKLRVRAHAWGPPFNDPRGARVQRCMDEGCTMFKVDGEIREAAVEHAAPRST